MNKEIGSFMEISETQSMNGKNNTFFDWIMRFVESNRIKLLSAGRQAIDVVIKDIEQRYFLKDTEKTCLLPQYTCETVVYPFIRNNWKIIYYPVDFDLNIKKDTLQKIIELYRPMVLLIHPYYGMDIDKEIKELVQQYRNEQQLVCIKDMTQGIALFNNCTDADYYVASLRKWFDIPDGAFVVSNHDIEICLEDENFEFVNAKKKVQIMKFMYLNGANVLKREFLELNERAEEYLNHYTGMNRISEYSQKRLDAIDVNAVFTIRSKNSDYLTERLTSDNLNIKIVGNSRKKSPLYFPVYVKEREKFQNYLIQKDIYTSILWKKSNVLPLITDKSTLYIYEHLLAIPCDQRYSIEDMEKIYYYIKKYEKEIA